MRRIAFRIILTITALVALGLVRVAQAREPVIIEDFTLPTNRCGFPIDVEVVSNNEFEDVTTLADGTTVTKITGKLVLRFTNAGSRGALTIVRNVSGPSTEIDHPDGTGTFIGEGLSWFAFGPGQPGEHWRARPCLHQRTSRFAGYRQRIRDQFLTGPARRSTAVPCSHPESVATGTRSSQLAKVYGPMCGS